MSSFIQIDSSNEGTHIINYNCMDECGNSSNSKTRNAYIKGDDDGFIHGKIIVEPKFINHPKGTSYIDSNVLGHNLYLRDSMFRIHNNSIITNTSEVNIYVEGYYNVYYTGYITLPNGFVYTINTIRTVRIVDNDYPPPPIKRPPIDDIYEEEDIIYLNFGTNPDTTDNSGQTGDTGNLTGSICAMYSIISTTYEYNRKLLIRKDNNIHVILDDDNSINITNIYQELLKGDSTSSINVINSESNELNPYIEDGGYYTTGPLDSNSLSYSGNWDILLIVNTDTNTSIEYGFMYDIDNNIWNVKTYIINSSYVESVSDSSISGDNIEIANLNITYISLCLDDPVITINGDNPLTHEVGNNFTDPGATALDDLGNNINVSVINNVNKDVVGSYLITYTATDLYGNSSSLSRNVNVIDSVAPVITLLGDNPMTLEALSNYVEPGATCSDNYDNSISVNISGTVDTNTPGNYTITYSASDSSGNQSIKTRTVIIEVTTLPNITILGNNPYNLNVFTNFTDPGATAVDALGNSINVSSSNNINKNVLGDYAVTYTATDTWGNSMSATRTVKVVDVTNPTITVYGDNPMTVELNSNYVDPGAIASDNYTNPINVSLSGSVNTAIVGQYTLTYTASDSSGNTASATRTVNVENTTPPSITINGDNPLYHEVKTIFNDPGATATDVYGNSLSITVIGVVNINSLGSYNLTYKATDSDGNIQSAIREVIVRDTTAPVITITGNTFITIDLNDSYTDQGATATDNFDNSISVSSSGSVDTTTPGLYIISYTATDSSNNSSSKNRTIEVNNTSPPIITIIGNNPLILALNATFTDPGATAVDAVGNTIYVSSTSTVDTSGYGNYAVYYSATDSWGNTGYRTRTVKVSDFEAPTITLIGPGTMTIILGQVFTDPGATANDPADGTVPVTITGNVNINIIGEYTITYRAEDTEGRVTTITRTVIVTNGPGGPGGSGSILEGGIPLSSSNFVSSGCININLSLPALSGYTGADPSINRAVIIRTPENGGTPVYLYDNGTRDEYKYPNSPLNLSGNVFELEKHDSDFSMSVLNDDGNFLEPQFYISSYNSDNWTNIAPVADTYFGGNWEIISVQGNWSSGQSVIVTAFIFNISNTRWETKTYIKSNTTGSIYKINNWSDTVYNGAGPHDIAGITVKFNMECIIPQCANIGYSASSYSFDRQIFTKYEDDVIIAYNEVNSSPNTTGSFEVMCAPYPMGGNVSVKNTSGLILSYLSNGSTNYNTGPVLHSQLSLDGNWELIVNDISNSSTGNIQHAIYYSGLYNKWYKKTYIFNSGVVTNITSGEVLGENIVLSNITFTHNGYNPHNIDRPDILLNDHTIIWLYGSSSTATETTTMTLDTQFPISWSLSGSFINAGVLSHSNTGNLVITYKKSQVLNGGTSGFDGYVDYSFSYIATALINNTDSFDYTINVTHRYYNPPSGGGGGPGGDPGDGGGIDDGIIKDIDDFNDPLNNPLNEP